MLFPASDALMETFDLRAGPAHSPGTRQDHPLRSASFEMHARFFDLLPALYKVLGGTAPEDALAITARDRRAGAELARLSGDFVDRLAAADSQATAARWAATRDFASAGLPHFRGDDSQLWTRLGIWIGDAKRAQERQESLFAWRGRGQLPAPSKSLLRRASQLVEPSARVE
jgi:hypothetical protein